MIEEIKRNNLDKLVKIREESYKSHELKDLFIEVTLNCNANCQHCGSRCSSKNIEEDLDAEYIKKALLSISKKYDARKIMLNITGGEPLVRKDLFEIMEYAVELGFKWGMTTNGILINDNIIKKMIDTKMNTISISLDGLKETHESFRGVPGSFDIILRNIQKLQEVPTIEAIQVTTVANKKNLKELEDLYQLMKDINIKYWRVINVDPIGNAKNNDEILLNKEEYKYLFDFIKTKRKRTDLKVDFGCAHYLGIALEKELREDYYLCATGINIASILNNGDISVCPDVERKRELAQGNIKTDDIVEVWENRFEIFRTEKRTQNEKCKNCSSWKFCCGDSYHTWNFTENKPNFCIKNIYGENIE